MKQIGKRVGNATRSELKGLLMSEWDRKNIAYLIAFYEKAFPGYIAHFIAQAREEVEPIINQKTRKQGFQFSHRMAIPQDLLLRIKEGYPAIIADKGQFEQFLRWFPQFDLWKK